MVAVAAPDIVVNNAVVRQFWAVENFAPEHWDEALAVDLSAPFHTIRLCQPGMKARGWGRIVNMASIYGYFSTADRVNSMSTKTALLGLPRAVAVARTEITGRAICPGTLVTPAIDWRRCSGTGRHSRKRRKASSASAGRAAVSSRVTLWRVRLPAGWSRSDIWYLSTGWLGWGAALGGADFMDRFAPISIVPGRLDGSRTWTFVQCGGSRSDVCYGW
jgi:NAD(P)-dependent dehydrogenase (short-subunit alcohol dehydrogenase family)